MLAGPNPQALFSFVWDFLEVLYHITDVIAMGEHTIYSEKRRFLSIDTRYCVCYTNMSVRACCPVVAILSHAVQFLTIHNVLQFSKIMPPPVLAGSGVLRIGL